VVPVRDHAALRAALDHDLLDAGAAKSLQALLHDGIAEQRLLVLEGRQRQIDERKDLDEGAARRCGIHPSARTIVAVEGDLAAVLSGGCEQFAQARASAIAIKR